MKKEELLERREKHFASKGRELREFKKGDKVLNFRRKQNETISI